MKKAVILHAWYNSPQNNWYPWLKAELEKKGYQVFMPDIPELRTDQPDMYKILTELERQYSFDKDTVIIGHSLSNLLAMRLATKYQLKALLMVAGWDFNDLTEGHKRFWETPIDHEAIKRNVANITVIHSDNDPYITAYQAEDMSKRLAADFLLVKGAGHFTSKDPGMQLPELLALI